MSNNESLANELTENLEVELGANTEGNIILPVDFDADLKDESPTLDPSQEPTPDTEGEPIAADGTKRGLHNKRLTPESLLNEDGLSMTYSRLGSIFSQLEIAGEPEKMHKLIDGFVIHREALIKDTVQEQLEAIASKLGLTIDGLKDFLKTSETPLVTDSVSTASTAKTRTSRTAKGKSIE
jgi:hypothetical protein